MYRKEVFETGDLSPHHLAHRQKGSNGLLQQELLTNELFDPAAEDVAAGFADDQTEVLQQSVRFRTARLGH